MADISEKRDLQYFENRKRRYKKNLTRIVISVIVIAVVGILFIIYQVNNVKYSDYKVLESEEREDSVSTQYVDYQGGILRYSKDGAMFMDLKGESIWNSTYDMNNPVYDICGDYLVISDVGSKKIELFNSSGHVISLEVLHPIIKTEVASQGVVAVLMDGGSVNYIQFFSNTGQELVDSRTTVENNGFAIDFSISDDGAKLATSYISINNGLIQSKVTFYNFGLVGQNYEARVVGGFDYGQTLVSKLEFINNTTAVVFGDDKLSIYKVEEIPELTYEETLETEVKSIAYNEEHIGLVQKNPDGDGIYIVTVYNEQGDKVLTEEIDYNYDNLTLTKDELIFCSKTNLSILRLNGNEKLSLGLDKGIQHIFPMSLKSEYLIIDQSNISKIKLVR